MLKRETFVNAIRALRKQEELTEQMNHIYRQMTDGIGHFEMDGLAQNALLQTLTDGMEDEHGYIMWWLYEAPDDDKSVSWEENGSLITVDLEDVNDFLIFWYAAPRNGRRRQSENKVCIGSPYVQDAVCG